MNNQFSIQRFGALVKKDFAENHKLYIIGALALLCVLTSFMVLVTGISDDSLDGSAGKILATFPYYYIYGFAVAISASMMFPSLRSKAGRVAYFSLPASSLEKFLEQLFVNVICFSVMFAVCLEFAELIRLALANVIYDSSRIITPFFDTTKHINHFDLTMPLELYSEALGMGGLSVSGATARLVALSLSGTFLSVAFMTVGAVLWPKYTFIKVYAVLYAVEIVLMLFFPVVSITFIDFDIHQYMNIRSLFNAIFWASLVGIVALFPLAYWLFTRKKVIS